jgi:hypothetical protein
LGKREQCAGLARAFLAVDLLEASDIRAQADDLWTHDRDPLGQ